MDDKFNPAAVGAFVLGLGALLIAGVLWLATGVGRDRDTRLYQAFIEESVAGLDVDAPVKYMGVDVGKVSEIAIDPLNARRVRLRFRIHPSTPIQQDSLAVLKTQGLTGIAYVEINGGTAGSPPLQAGADGQPPTIAFKRSLSAQLESVLGDVLRKIDHTTSQLNAVLDAPNRAALHSLLANGAQLAQALADPAGPLNQGLQDAARTARASTHAVDTLRPAVARTLARIDRSADALANMASSTQQASEQVGAAAQAASAGLQQLQTESLPELTALMSELRELSSALRQLSQQTQAAPASVLHGRPRPAPGPGEAPAPPP
jgi:phospholipid/cholesterol/gamma-HCH transport system substrate-binding protein